MNIAYYFKNLEPSDALKDYASDKLAKLSDRLHHIEGIDVRFQLERQNQMFEITVHADSTVLHLKKADKDMYAAIDNAVDSLHGQISKHRDKLDSKEVSLETLIPTFDERPIGSELSIAVFDALGKPMDDLDAVMQVQASRFRFLMYRRINEDRYSLILSRPDGNYSLVYPHEDDDGYKESVNILKDNELQEISASTYPMSRLSVAEAVDRLEENKMDFLAFVNDDTGRMNILFHGRHGELVLKRPPFK